MESTLEDAVVSTIGSPDLQDGLADFAELGLDEILSESVLRDVPVVGTVVKVIRAAGHVRDALLVKKLAKFLRELHMLSFEQRRDFCESLGSEKQRRRVGEALLLLLDRLDDMDKPTLVARVFRAYVRGEIDRSQFELLASAIDRLHLSRIPILLEFYSNPDVRISTTSADVEAYQAFAFLGLVRLTIGSNGLGLFDSSMAGGSGSYVQNDDGRILADILARDV